MKTATVRDLRNHYTGILRWIASGEVVQITRRGKPVARLIPETPHADSQIDWRLSPAMDRDRSKEKKLTAEESLILIREAGGQW
jgi:prevent-host-death family protein